MQPAQKKCELFLHHLFTICLPGMEQKTHRPNKNLHCLLLIIDLELGKGIGIQLMPLGINFAASGLKFLLLYFDHCSLNIVI